MYGVSKGEKWQREEQGREGGNKKKGQKDKNDYEQTENIQAELLKKDKRTGENKCISSPAPTKLLQRLRH